MVCVVGRMRDLILQLSKSSIYSTKPIDGYKLNAGRKVQSCSAHKCVLSFLMSIPTRIESLMLAIMLINTPVFKDNTCIFY
ncbi:hypothetical protein E7703_11945 [Citrobacter portucalensis]|nr:hypothetical protein E7703_11945 [Citrobacter portucalensis]